MLLLHVLHVGHPYIRFLVVPIVHLHLLLQMLVQKTGRIGHAARGWFGAVLRSLRSHGPGVVQAVIGGLMAEVLVREDTHVVNLRLRYIRHGYGIGG